MHFNSKYLKTSSWFAIAWMILLVSPAWSQSPADSLNYYSWEVSQKADPDTIFAIDFTRERLEKLPDQLRKYNNLKGLKLNKNKLEALPDYFKNFDELTHLYLSKNELSYFPHQLFYLEQLEVLDLSRNEIGSIPAGIKALRNLRYLDIWDNRLTRIDPYFAELQQLQFIDFRGTTFAPSFVEKWTRAFPDAAVEFDKPCKCLE